MTSNSAKSSVKPVSEVDTDTLIKQFLIELGEPSTDTQTIALAAFKDGNSDVVRVSAATALDDPYCKALGYMVSIPKKPPTLAILLAESARAIAEVQRAKTVARLEHAISSVFEQ